MTTSSMSLVGAKEARAHALQCLSVRAQSTCPSSWVLCEPSAYAPAIFKCCAYMGLTAVDISVSLACAIDIRVHA